MSNQNYKVAWVGIVEGYGITETDDNANDHDVFRLYRDAKNKAVENAKSDVEGAKRGLQATRSIRKDEV